MGTLLTPHGVKEKSIDEDGKPVEKLLVYDSVFVPGSGHTHDAPTDCDDPACRRVLSEHGWKEGAAPAAKPDPAALRAQLEAIQRQLEEAEAQQAAASAANVASIPAAAAAEDGAKPKGRGGKKA